MHRSWVILGVIAALSLASGAYFLRARRVQTVGANPQPSVQLIDARRGEISEIVTGDGGVCGNRDLVVNCLASGEVVNLPVALGDCVKKGEIICQLDPAQELSAVDQAKAALSHAVRKLEETLKSDKLAEDDMDISIQQADESINSLHVKATNFENKAGRQKELLSRSLTSQEQFETAETEASEADMEFQNAILAKQDLKDRSEMLKTEKAMQIEAIQDEVRNDELALKDATDRLNSTTISAPMDGVISDLKISMNNWIEQSGGPYAGQPVMTISDLSRIFVNVTVGERKIALVHAGEKAELSAAAYPGKIFCGSVLSVTPTGSGSGDEVSFGVKIEVTDPDKNLLKPPMTASARIIQQTRADVLIIPNRAVERRDAGTFVTVLGKDGRQIDREVQLGICDGANDEIVGGGLSAGDRVVVRHAGAGVQVAQSLNE
jgi:RND family efflux transporter MFP subunit